MFPCLYILWPVSFLFVSGFSFSGFSSSGFPLSFALFSSLCYLNTVIIVFSVRMSIYLSRSLGHLRACAAIKKQESAGAKEHPGLRGRLQGYASRGPPGAELWLFELLYLHNASAANSMPEAWHEVNYQLGMQMWEAAGWKGFTWYGKY